MLFQQMLNWIGGVLGISERCEKRYGVDPIFFRDKKRNVSKLKLATKNWQQKIGNNSNQ